MTYKSHVKFNRFNAIISCSMVLCGKVEGEGEGEGETAFIDQCAVAAGKNIVYKTGIKMTIKYRVFYLCLTALRIV